jgi:hypothetical protein
MKKILIGTSYFLTIIATAFVTVEIHNEFLTRQIMIDKHSLRLAEQQADIDLRKKRLETRKAEWNSDLAREVQQQQLRQSQQMQQLEQAQKLQQIQLNQAAQLIEAKSPAKVTKIIETNRIGKVCDEHKCVYQTEIVEKTFVPFTNSWTITNKSKGTETELLN